MHSSNEIYENFQRPTQENPRKIDHLEEMYEQRLNSLSKQFQIFFTEIENDEILKAMKENSLSQEFANQRAAELFNAIMNSEQEYIIKKLQKEVADLKDSLFEYENENRGLKHELNDLEKKYYFCEDSKEKIIKDYEIVTNQLNLTQSQFDENLKRKEIDIMTKTEKNEKALENALFDVEYKYKNARKEIELLQNAKESREVMQNEIEILRNELKNQEKYSNQQLDEIKIKYNEKLKGLNEILAESQKKYENLSLQFKNYQQKSEELAGDQQQVIKNILEKSKKFRQKIVVQKEKISNLHAQIQSQKEIYEKKIVDCEEKLKVNEKNFNLKESESISKHQSQIIQLQQNYQNMMDTKLREMQKEIDIQIEKSKEHDKEVKIFMDERAKEIERNYLSKILHEKFLAEKENSLNEKFQKKIDEIQKENTKIHEELKFEISSLRRENENFIEKVNSLQKSEESLKIEILKEKEKLAIELNQKLIKLKESESTKYEISKELEKLKINLESQKNLCKEENLNNRKLELEKKNLQSQIIDLENSLESLHQTLRSTKSQYEKILSEKIDRSQYFQEKEKNRFLEHELENRILKSSRIEEELEIAKKTLKNSEIQRSGDLNLIDLQQSQNENTKNKLKELENYSQKLLREIDNLEKNQLELKEIINNDKEEINNLNQVLEDKDKDLVSIKYFYTNKESENRIKYRANIEKISKYVKNSIFFLKKQLLGLSELIIHEFSAFTKTFTTSFQELQIKSSMIPSKFSEKLEIFSNDLRSYYRSKLHQIENFIITENFHWNDSETEGIRKALKGIIEKKQMIMIEFKTLKDNISNLKAENEAMYRENQKLQIKLHANNEAFDQLQREVNEEASKIKLRLESSSSHEKLPLSARGNYYRN